MSRVYKFDNAQDMIDLAKDVQTNVYWNESFYYNDGEIRYKDFWDLCEMALSQGYTLVEKDNYNNVTFLKE